MNTLDLTLLPLYRLSHQELSSLPGLIAITSPHKTARGREHDSLIVYLVLTGNATLSTAEYLQLTSQTASRFFETSGALTSAMRAAATSLNQILLERNMASTGHGQYAVGWLVLAVLRGAQCTLLQSGPTHIYTLGSEAIHRTYDPALSGKGLGVSQVATYHFTQTELQPGDRMIFAGKPPAQWEQALISEQHPGSIEATRRRLLSLSKDDVNALLIQAQSGTGNLNVLRPATSGGGTPKLTAVSEPPAPPTETESLPPLPQQESISELSPEPEPEAEPPAEEDDEPEFVPSAYAIPPQPKDSGLPRIEEVLPDFPASIPHATSSVEETPSLREMDGPIMDEEEEPAEPRQPSEATRQVARGMLSGMAASRRAGDAFSRLLQKFLPNLLPSSEGSSTPSSTVIMIFIAIVVPLLVVTAGSTVYLKYGRSYQYDNFYLQAENARNQALNATDDARKRDGWQAVLFYLDKADAYRQTPESQALRQEAQSNLDGLLGIKRMTFAPIFSSGVGAQISRLAASETDLYMLDAQNGRVLHASIVNSNFEMDDAFRCEQGKYGDYQVGPIVDIQILPRLNSLDAGVMGIDATGNLLYCSPGQVGQAIPLPLPDSNWGRVTGFTLDGGNLYVLDAQSRAVWVYVGRDASFVDQPYFFFGGQIPKLEDSIDLAVSGDELFLLHSDGHLSTCSYSRLETVPTRCEDPAPLVNNIAAYKDINLFEKAHITQMMLTSPPDANLLLLDADNRSVLRISSRTLELQNQIYPMPGNSIKPGPASAMTVNPNRVLFLAVGDQIYFAENMP